MCVAKRGAEQGRSESPCLELGLEGGGRHTHLRKATIEAGSPATLRAGGPTAQALATQDTVTALRVSAPGQVGTALHIASQEGLLKLWITGAMK
jgi:hypothetical protein